jgi:predicted metalloprotease
MIRWLPILCAAMLAAGCGSSSGSNKASARGTPTATAPAVQGSQLRRLRQVPPASGPPPSSAASGTRAFLRRVFDDAEAMWRAQFERAGMTYRPARLTIFDHTVHTACGTQTGAVGPFYCPASFGVYLDTRFFAALSQKVGVRIGDFAQAYVVAHELGHHVQTLLGITAQVAIADRRDPAGRNARSVRSELQADCFAGVWMRSAYKQGDVFDADLQDAINAATVVGDDFLSNASGASRPPEQWTHGSSAQRRQWLKTGFREGDPSACDTFAR